MLASFGLLFIVQNVAILVWGADVKGYSYLSYGVNLGGAIFAANRLVTLLFAVIMGAVFYLFLALTRLGKAIRAAAQDQEVAGLMGVNINLVLALCFGFGALMAGIGGSLISICYPIQPTMGFQYTMIAIIVVVLGGMGSIPGSFIGGFLLGLVGSIVTYIEPGLSLSDAMHRMDIHNPRSRRSSSKNVVPRSTWPPHILNHFLPFFVRSMWGTSTP